MASSPSRTLLGARNLAPIDYASKDCCGGMPQPAPEAHALPGRSCSRADSFVPFLPLRCFGRNQKPLSDPQFARVLDVVEREQIVVRDFELLCDRHRVIAFCHNVNFPRLGTILLLSLLSFAPIFDGQLDRSGIFLS